MNPDDQQPALARPHVDDWRSTQSLVAFMAMLIVAGSVAAVFWHGDAQLIGQTVGGVLAIGSAVVGFYFGSSRGSQAKDTLDKGGSA